MSIKQSLIDNEKDVLAELPKEFHDDFKKSIENIEEPGKLTEEEVRNIVLAELPGKFHDDFKKTFKMYEKPENLSEEETKTEIEKNLKVVKE